MKKALLLLRTPLFLLSFLLFPFLSSLFSLFPCYLSIIYLPFVIYSSIHLFSTCSSFSFFLVLSFSFSFSSFLSFFEYLYVAPIEKHSTATCPRFWKRITISRTHSRGRIRTFLRVVPRELSFSLPPISKAPSLVMPCL